MSEIIRYKNANDRFNRLFENFFADLPIGMSVRSVSPYNTTEVANGYPSANTYKNDTGYVVEVAVPGVNKNNIDINMQHQVDIHVSRIDTCDAMFNMPMLFRKTKLTLRYMFVFTYTM